MSARSVHTAAAITALAFALCAAPRAAAAFAELTRYAEPAIDGGGEGRYFTGAPPDGLGCSVCHGGGRAPAVTLDGLPDHLVAGTAYQLSLTWPDDARTIALALELVDAAGRHPAVTIAAPGQQPAGMHCTTPAGTSAASTVDVGSRRIVAVAPCGARELVVTFTPSSDEALYLGAAVVASDGSETVTGDGVVELRRTLAGADAGCSAGGAPGLPIALALAGVIAVDRRRRRVRT